MKDPKIKVKIQHSRSNPAWIIIGAQLGAKYKVARVPYPVSVDVDVTKGNRLEALEHAEFIAYCFNHSSDILPNNKN